MTTNSPEVPEFPNKIYFPNGSEAIEFLLKHHTQRFVRSHDKKIDDTSYILKSAVDEKLKGVRVVHGNYGKAYRGHFEEDDAKYYYRLLNEAMQAIKQLIESSGGEK